MEVHRARRSEHHFTDGKTEALESGGQCLIKTRPPDQAQSCPHHRRLTQPLLALKEGGCVL